MNTSKVIKVIITTSKGQGIVEYALIITLVALALVSALRTVTVPLNNIFSSVIW